LLFLKIISGIGLAGQVGKIFLLYSSNSRRGIAHFIYSDALRRLEFSILDDVLCHIVPANSLARVYEASFFLN